MRPQSRRWHYMRGNSKTSTPSSIVILDTETRPDQNMSRLDGTPHRLRCWCAVHLRLDGSRVHSRVEKAGVLAEDFWAWLLTRLNPRRPTWLFAHNLSFDMLALRMVQALDAGPLCVRITQDAMLADGGLREVTQWDGLVCLDESTSIVELRHKDTGAKCILLDSRNWWRCPLADIGKEIGHEKTAIPGDKAPLQDWADYCFNDVSILEQAVIGLIKTIRSNDLGNMRYTAPAQGLQAYRHRFMDHQILVHNHAKSLALERSAYFGGACQIFRHGTVKGTVHVLDVQSCYPAIGANCTLPYRWLGYMDNPSLKELDDAASSLWVIARVKLFDCRMPMPVRLGNRLIMATGTFETSLHWPELLLAMVHARRVLPIYASTYAADVLFSRYSRELWCIRRNAELADNTVEANCIKLIMNGLHGKLGQRQLQWINRPDLVSDQDWMTWKRADTRTGDLIEYRTIGGLVQERRKPGASAVRAWVQPHDQDKEEPAIADESTNSCPSIAGAFTSWSRFNLSSLITIAGYDNVFYTDTDCLHVNDAGLSALQAKGEIKAHTLGALSIKSSHAEAEYLGPKAYRLDDKWTIAGRKASAQDLGTGKWRQLIFTGWPSMLSAGINGELVASWHEYQLEDGVNPSRIGPDGKVQPIVLGQKQSQV